MEYMETFPRWKSAGGGADRDRGREKRNEAAAAPETRPMPWQHNGKG